MTEQPLVSVIIPTYNRAERVGDAVRSALNQSHDNIEVLVIDDCSDDHTETVVNGIDDSRVSYHCNDTNRGAPYSRNRGVDLSHGRYVQFLDDDDVLYEQKIERQITCFNASDVSDLGVVTCGVAFKKSYDTSTHMNEARGSMYEDLLGSYCLYGTHHMLIRRDVVETIRFDEDLRSSQEYDLIIRIAEQYGFDSVPEVLCEQRQSADQISTDYERKLDGAWQLWSKHNERFWSHSKSCWAYNQLRFSYLLVKFWLGHRLNIPVNHVLP